MSKKLSGNGLWESSRMMLPEHKEQLLAFRHKMKRKPKPLLDEQLVEQLARQVSEAMEQEREVKVIVFDPFEAELILAGKIEKNDPQLKRIKIVGTGHRTWVPWEDILRVE